MRSFVPEAGIKGRDPDFACTGKTKHGKSETKQGRGRQGNNRRRSGQAMRKRRTQMLNFY